MKFEIQLNPGERYIGRINDEHIILLPGDKDCTTWKKAMAWAKGIGGDLPTRVEQAMLWAGFRDQFEKDWYWSNETYHANNAYACYQSFDNGFQDISLNDDCTCRARAVRRVKVVEQVLLTETL